MNQDWFNTLNEALNAENLIDLWPLGSNINYGQTVQQIVPTGEFKGKKQIERMKLISVYRNERGMYERPVHYYTN